MTTATAPAAPTAQQTLTEQVLQILRDSDAPLTRQQIEDRLPPGKRTKNEVRVLLREMVERKQLYHCGKAERQDRYWDRDEAEKIRERIRAKAIECLTAGPRTMADLLKAIKPAVPGQKEKVIKDQIAALREQKHLHSHPGRSAKIGLQPPDLMATVVFAAGPMKSLRAALEKAQKAGATPDQFFQRLRELLLSQPATVPPATTSTAPAPQEATAAAESALPTAPPYVAPPADADRELKDLVLKAVGEAGPGVPVPVVDLRQQMPAEYRDKARFDRAVWKLVEQDKLYVVPHNYPAGLSDAERADLLTDPQGEYYAYVAQHG